MLQEMIGGTRREGESARRWFFSHEQDLIVWYDEDGSVRGSGPGAFASVADDRAEIGPSRRRAGARNVVDATFRVKPKPVGARSSEGRDSPRPGGSETIGCSIPEIVLTATAHESKRAAGESSGPAYDKYRGEHALTWRRDRGFEHSVVDDGEHEASTNHTPFLYINGPCDVDRVMAQFLEISAAVPGELVEMVVERLSEFDRVHRR